VGGQPEAESPDGLARRQIRRDEEEPDKTGRCDTFHLAALIMHKRDTRCSQNVSSIGSTETKKRNDMVQAVVFVRV
jgi:hypothetical protein